MSKAILYDATLCIGCKQCEGACAEQNKLPYDDKVAGETIQSEHKYTVVLTQNDRYMRRLCQHCNEPACASVCPVGAFHKTKEGPVVYDCLLYTSQGGDAIVRGDEQHGLVEFEVEFDVNLAFDALHADVVHHEVVAQGGGADAVEGALLHALPRHGVHHHVGIAQQLSLIHI